MALVDAGAAWETEYGDPSSPTDFPYLRAYSPLHNVQTPPGSQQYPAMMLLTGTPVLGSYIPVPYIIKHMNQ